MHETRLFYREKKLAHINWIYKYIIWANRYVTTEKENKLHYFKAYLVRFGTIHNVVKIFYPAVFKDQYFLNKTQTRKVYQH